MTRRRIPGILRTTAFLAAVAGLCMSLSGCFGDRSSQPDPTTDGGVNAPDGRAGSGRLGGQPGPGGAGIGGGHGGRGGDGGNSYRQ